MAELNICEPLRPAKTGYRRSWTDADRAVNHVSGDPDQPVGAVVKQKVSGIEYNVWNGLYERSWTESDIEVNHLSDDPDQPVVPVQPDILSGWNGDYIKQVRLKEDNTFEYKVEGMSQQYVEQTLYKGHYVLKETMYPAPALLVPDEKTLYDEYVSNDVCNLEVYLDEEDGDNGDDTTFLTSATLCLEDDRDNVFKTEFSFQAIQLEDNTTLSHIDYTSDYFRTEETDIALSMEQGGLIEPYGI